MKSFDFRLPTEGLRGRSYRFSKKVVMWQAFVTFQASPNPLTAGCFLGSVYLKIYTNAGTSETVTAACEYLVLFSFLSLAYHPLHSHSYSCRYCHIHTRKHTSQVRDS